MKLKLLSVLFVFFISTLPAKAGLFLEPMFGFNITKIESSSTKEDLVGTMLGGRIGYKLPLLGAWGAIEVDIDYLKDDDDQTNRSNKYGIGAGMNFPMGLRAWAFYMLDSLSLPSKEELDGKTFKVGLGYMVLGLLSINAEYEFTNYDDFKDSSSNISLTDVTDRAFLFSLSLPIDMFGM